MKGKNKLCCLMIISILLCAYMSISISASTIWDDGETIYEIEGWLFIELEFNHPIIFQTNNMYAYIYYENETIMYLVAFEEYGVYLVSDGNTEEVVEIEFYNVYLSSELYNHWKNAEGSIPTVNIIQTGGRAKDIFNAAVTTTANVGSTVINALYYNNSPTLLGWICCCGLGVSLTVTLIKIISNTIRR